MNIFDFAIAMEKSGSRFYHYLSEHVENKEVKDFFHLLALDEEHLVTRFEAMKDMDATKKISDSSALDSAHNIFEEFMAQKDSLKIENDTEAYECAMKVERTICKLYNEAAEKELDPDVQRLLLTIASEERREVESIKKLYELAHPPHSYVSWGEFINQGEDFTYMDPVKTKH